MAILDLLIAMFSQPNVLRRQQLTIYKSSNCILPSEHTICSKERICNIQVL